MATSNGDYAVPGQAVMHQNEIHSDRKELNVEFEGFYGIKPSKVDRRFKVSLSDMSYMPKVREYSLFFLD